MSEMITNLVILSTLLCVTHEFDAKINEVCDDRFKLATSLTQEQCPANHYYFQHGTHGCFPHCVKIEPIQNICNPSKPCPPAYDCKEPPTRSSNYAPVFFTCQLNPNSCMKYHVNYASPDKPFYDAFWKPKCLPDETWAPVQCKGEKFSGRCFCYDAIGNRLPGHQWSDKAENMTCACSRKKAELQANRDNLYVSLHCDDQGNYEPLQCNLGQCWCVESKTGDVVSTIVTENMMKTLPCYNLLQDTLEEAYMRQCESHQYAQVNLVHELSTHGTDGFKFQYMVCDGDGTYGPYKILEERASCVWKDGTPLGSYAITLATDDVINMNCNCARDKKIFEMVGMQHTLVCEQNGNYKEVQSIATEQGKRYYCIDSDGFRKCEGEFITLPDCSTTCPPPNS